MKALAPFCFLVAALAAFSQIPQQQVEIQRGLIQRDQQSGRIFAPRPGDLHSQPAAPMRPAGQSELLPYERQSMERERRTGQVEGRKEDGFA